jgi:hypothetical protein
MCISISSKYVRPPTPSESWTKHPLLTAVRRMMRVLLIAAICFFIPYTSYSASWVKSSQGGMTIRHPRDWKVLWRQNGFTVVYSSNSIDAVINGDQAPRLRRVPV